MMAAQFCLGMIRWLLNLDKYKCQRFAKGQSKYHSVERLHTAENRTLSHSGIISEWSMKQNFIIKVYLTLQNLNKHEACSEGSCEAH